jgi:hypothetical protein
VSYEHPTSILRASYEHPTSILRLSHALIASQQATQSANQPFKSILRASYDILRVSYEHPTSILRASNEHPTSILRASYEYPVSILRLSHELIASQQATQSASQPFKSILPASYEYPTSILRVSYELIASQQTNQSASHLRLPPARSQPVSPASQFLCQLASHPDSHGASRLTTFGTKTRSTSPKLTLIRHRNKVNAAGSLPASLPVN